MATFVPVDHDPFAAPRGGVATAAPQQGRPPLGFVPIDHDPFAGASPSGGSPTGFASRAQREGTEQEIRQVEYLADAVRTRLLQDNASPLGRVDAYMRGAASWVPGMNKLAAAGDAAFGAGQGESFGDRYSDNLMRQRALDTADEALNPGSRLAGQVSGLVATARLMPGVTVARGTGMAANTLNAAATGGIYSALSGGVENDGGVADKAQAALETGALGLGLGAVAPTFVRGAEAFARAAGKLAGKVAAPFRAATNPEAEAARRINDAFARDGVTDPAARLAELQSTGANAVLGDVGGETTRRLARSSANLSPEAGEALSSAVSDRFAGQADRVTDIIRGLGGSNAGRTLEEMQQAARAALRPAYARAYMEGGTGVWNDELAGLAQAPAVQDAFRSVVRTAANKTVVDGMPPVRNPFTTDAAGNLTLARGADGSMATPNLQFWDYVQRELRGKAGEAARTGNKDLAGDFNNLRRGILNQLDNMVPAFRQARSGAAQAFGAEDALEAGQKFVMSRMANDAARKAVDRMSPQERELFGEGFRSDLIAKIREIGDGRDVVKAVFGNPAMRERVSIALGPRQSTELQAALNIESALLPLQQAVKGNSTTVQQALGLGLGGAAGYLQGGDSTSTVAGAIAGAALTRGKIKINQGLAKRIGEMLASGDTGQLQNVARMATKSPAVMRFLESFGDEAAKVAGLQSVPLEITLRPRGAPVNLPAAAEEEQR